MNLETILTVAIIVYLFVCAFVAFVRGSKKSIFRLTTVILSAVAAIVGVAIFKNMLGDASTAEQINAILAQNGMQKILDIAAASPLLEEVILKTAGGVIAPILFLIIFFAFSTVTYILYFIFTLIFRKAFKTEKSGVAGGIISFVLGSVQGIIVSAALILTIISYTLIIPKITPKLENTDALNESQRDAVLSASSTVESANNSPIIHAYRVCGLDAAANALMTYEIETETESLKINTADEISSISELLFVFMDLSHSKMADYGEEEAILIQRLGKSFTQSDILSLAGAELLHSATQSWKNDEPFAGIAMPNLGEDMQPLLTKLINVFNESTTKTETFNEDIITVTDLIAVFAKNGILSASTQIQTDPNALFDCLSKDGVISDITLTLNTSERLDVLVPEITNLGLKTLANSLGIAGNTAEIYNETLKNIASHITSTKTETDPEKRAEALKPLLKTEFDNIGVTIDPEYIDILAPALIEDFGSFEGEITPEFIAEFFDVYFNASTPDAIETAGGSASVLPLGSSSSEKTYTFPKYANATLYLTTGAYTAAKNSLTKIETADPEKTDAFKASSALFSGMRSSDTATINRATIKDFLVDSDCVITDPEAESAALEAIVKEVVAIMNALKSSEGNGVEIVKDFSSRLGGALDSLSHTQMYGSDKTFTLFTAILQSKTLRETTKITVSDTIRLTGKHREKADSVSFGSLMNVLGSTVDVITSMQNNEITTDSIQGLIGNLTPDNSEIIKEVITVERMEDLGIPKEKAETSTEIMGDLFENLGKIEDPETYEAEAKAVENIINLGVAAKENMSGGGGQAPSQNLFTKPDADSSEEGTLGCTADDMVNNIMSSTAVCNTVLSTVKEKDTTDPFGVSANLTESDTEAIKNACDNYVVQNSDKSPEEMEKITETLDSITKLLGITDWTIPTVTP